MAAKLRAALIGYGGMGRFHAARYPRQKNVELVAVCDSDPGAFEKDKEKNELSGIVRCHSFRELVKNTGFDLLDICLPTHLHAEYAVQAMKAGYHVLCETPMARTLLQADRMIRFIQRRAKVSCVSVSGHEVDPVLIQEARECFASAAGQLGMREAMNALTQLGSAAHSMRPSGGKPAVYPWLAERALTSFVPFIRDPLQPSAEQIGRWNV